MSSDRTDGRDPKAPPAKAPHPRAPRPEGASNRPNAAPGRTMRIRFARTGPAAWLAHLDLMRTFERSLRRTGLPLAFTQGFSPHPVMTFALPLGVGVDTEADVADIALSEDVAPEDFAARLSAAFPEGLRVLSAHLAPEGGESLMAAVRAATYELSGPGVGTAAGRLPPEGPLVVEKKGKDGAKPVDVRPLLIALEVRSPDGVRVLVKAGSRENLRPDLFLQALSVHAGLPSEEAADAAIVRTALWTAGPDGALGILG